ncbi:MAG: methylmalonyl-CoA epimerase [Chloroflexota bacterium]|nr:methylmalonyl-CoA epimerase [Chloroflexota bacterium]
MIKKLHHVAVAVESVEAALRFYRDILGLTDITIMTLQDRGLRVALIPAGDSEIELLEPIGEDSTVRRFLDRRGSGLHHICFQVDDIEAAMREFESRGAEFIEPVPRAGAVGLVSFMPPAVADGVLVELAQVPSPHEPPATAESAPSTASADAETANLADAGELASPMPSPSSSEPPKE